jgi:hypothetical protein
VLSTHWFEHHDLTERELRFLVLLARQAADLIEYWQSHASRQSVKRTRRAISLVVPILKNRFTPVRLLTAGLPTPWRVIEGRARQTAVGVC